MISVRFFVRLVSLPLLLVSLRAAPTPEVLTALPDVGPSPVNQVFQFVVHGSPEQKILVQ